MARTVPFYADYKTIGQINTGAEWLLWISVIASFISLLIDLKQIPDQVGTIQHWLSGISCILALCYFAIDLLTNYMFQCAEARRRNDFFDNSLNTALADQNSEGYFTNSSISAGIYKMGVNCFENSLFTKNIAGKYLRQMFVKSVIVLLVFLATAIFGGNHILVTILQLTLPLTIIQQTIRLLIFKNRIDNVHELFKRIFAISKGEQQDHLLINNVTNYETTLAWACIKLPDEIFDELNPTLSLQWDVIKQRLNIQ